MCKAAQTYLNHLVFVDVYVDGPKRAANTVDVDCVIRDGHILLLYGVHLLPEFMLVGGRVGGEDILQVLPRFLRHLASEM